MAAATTIISNFYRDSVSLMQLSSRLAKLPGVRQASAVMASPANLALLDEAGLLNGAAGAGPNDLLIAVDGDSKAEVDAALKAATASLEQAPAAGGGPRRERPRSIEMGLTDLPAADLALISTPGDYAAAEAMKALRLGLNVMLFSDNVAGADEVALKRYARDHDLMVMGPDCGTAIIGGVPLGFANVVRRGRIGVVGASGTGTQQVTCLIDRLGEGVSHAIGTGGHDLSAEVGGITMLQGLAGLAGDDATEVIVLVSKPPAQAVAERVLAAAREIAKPVVVAFLGSDGRSIAGGNLFPARTLDAAARAAVALAQGRKPRNTTVKLPPRLPRPWRGQKYVRGLYSGGTFCYEASLLLGEELGPVFSNTPVGKAGLLPDPWRSEGHTLVDLGDDLFTRGRPHPMIDHRLRNERIAAEAADPETAVILLDVVLGHGSHKDPSAEIVPAIRAAKATAAAARRNPVFVGFVCGTERDPQGLARQEAGLRAAGMLLAASNAEAVRLAAAIAGGRA